MTMPQTMSPRIMRSPAGIAAVKASTPQLAQPMGLPNQRPASRYDSPNLSPSPDTPARDATMVGYPGAQTSFLGGMKAQPGPVPNAGEPVSRQGIGSSYDAGDGTGRLPGYAAGAAPRMPMPRPAFVPKSPMASNVLGGRFGGAQSFAELMRGASGRASGFKNEYLGPQSTAVSMTPAADQEVTGSEPTGSGPGGGSDSGFATTGAGLAAAEQQTDPSHANDTGGQGVILGAGSMFDGGADIGGMHISDGLLVDYFGNTHGSANNPDSWDDIARAAAEKRGWTADTKIQEPGQMLSQGTSDDPRTESGRTQAEDILREILGWDAPQMDQGALEAKIRADEAATAYQTGKGIQSAMSMGGRGRMGAGWMAGTSAGLAAQGGLQHQQTAANMRLQAQMQNFQAQRDFFDRQIQAIMAMAGYADNAVARQAVAQLQNQRIAADRSLAELQHQWSQEITPASIFGLLGNAGGQIGGALLGRWAFGGG